MFCFFVVVFFFFWGGGLLFNILVNNFSVIFGQSHCFLGILPVLGEHRVS